MQARPGVNLEKVPKVALRLLLIPLPLAGLTKLDGQIPTNTRAEPIHSHGFLLQYLVKQLSWLRQWVRLSLLVVPQQLVLC